MTKTDENMHQDLMMKTGMLVEALPFMRRYSGKTILVKFGGHAMGKADYVAAFASDIALLDQVGARPVVVHGGGPQIGAMLDKLKIESNFIDGLRVTDEATISGAQQGQNSQKHQPHHPDQWQPPLISREAASGVKRQIGRHNRPVSPMDQPMQC